MPCVPLTQDHLYDFSVLMFIVVVHMWVLTGDLKMNWYLCTYLGDNLNNVALD